MRAFNEVFIASDHAGLRRKQEMINHFASLNWLDLGPVTGESVDYPDFADKVCQRVLATGGPGVLICGSGQGMAMRANRHSGIRAALCWNAEVVKLARAHNDANVLCLGGRLMSLDDCVTMLQVFLATEFEGGRHQVRVSKIDSPL